MRLVLRPFCYLLFFLTMVAPGLAQAQTFSETMGTGATEDQAITGAGSYYAQRKFDNDTEKGLQYSGSAKMSLLNPSTGYAGASGTVSVNYPVNTTTNTNFFIADINVLGLSNAQIAFALYVPAGGPTTVTALRNDLRLQLSSSSDASTYTNYNTNAAYVPVGGGTTVTPGAWNQFVLQPAPLPAASAQYLRMGFVRLAAGGSRVYQLDDVVFSGTLTPALYVDPASLSFGSQTVNTESAPQTIDVSGANLTQDIQVTAPAGFRIAPTGTTAFASTLTLQRNANGAVNTSIDVEFLPTAVINYIDEVTFTSSGLTSKVGVSGRGQAAPATLTTSTSGPLNFASVAVGAASATQSFVVNGENLGTNTVTVTAPTGYQVRVGNGVFASSTTITPVSGTVSAVQVDVRFVPTMQGTMAGSVDVTGAGITRSVQVTGEGTAVQAGPTINSSTTSISFGNITASGSGDVRQVTVSGTGLGADITITPSANIQIRNTAVGGSVFSNSPIMLVRNNGTVSPTTIEVRLVATIAGTSFSGTIGLTSTNATPVNIAVSGTSNGNVSDISITNPTNNTFTFATRPNSTSVAQTFLVAGTNLLQPLTLEPVGTTGQYFELSEDGTTFSRTLTFTPDQQGNVTQRLVYVHFTPGNRTLTVNAIIRATSMPAPDRDVSVTGISEPTVRLSRTIGSFGDAVVKNTPTQPVSVQLEGFLLGGDLDLRYPEDTDDPTRNAAKTPQFEFSVNNGASYVKSVRLTTDGNGNVNQQLLVRYAPTRVGAATQDLEFRNISLNSNTFFALNSGNGRSQGFAIAEIPSAQSTATISRPPGSTTASLSFVLTNAPTGTSYGQNRLVIATTTYSQLPPRLFPQAKQNFNPGVTQGGNYVYGSGTAVEASSNTYVVFSGAATSFTVGNLDPNLTYYFYSFEFNDDKLLNAENYRVPSNQPLTPLPVELLSFTAQLRNGQVNLNWVTASEKNNRGFEIQRSQDGKIFSTIAYKEGRGTTSARTSYDAVDKQPLAGLSYYRLKQLDADGAVSFSPPVAIKNAGLAEATFYPNPTSGPLTISLPQAQTENGLKVSITDLTGRVMVQQALSPSGEVDMSKLQAGTYIVTVGEGNTKITRKVVKY